MNTRITLYALQKFEQGKHEETVYYTEWDDVLYYTRYCKTVDMPDADGTVIIEFEVEADELEEIRMTDTESLDELLKKSTTKIKHYLK
jgi:hypothetical protein